MFARINFSRKMHCIVVGITAGSAATVVKPVTSESGFEAWRRLAQRLQPQEKTLSKGSLTSVLEAQFQEHNFEEYFEHWENEMSQFETSSGSALADEAKIAILLNKTSRARQQHLR